jgi:FAD/FMN-containing dehydrogenase
MKDNLQSWGGVPAEPQVAKEITWRHLPLPETEGRFVLPRGLGRSYGDTCLNTGHLLLSTAAMDRFILLDEAKGTVRCEAGMSLDVLLQTIVPRGWFLPVLPGTRFVTVGGALAHDIHGKNHHRHGTFGCHVTKFELLRSDGSRLVCSSEENAGFFRATIGGMGLTGLVTWVEFRLLRITSSLIESEVTKFRSLDEFFQINADANRTWDYTVAWVDFTSGGANLGRGHYIAGRHAQTGPLEIHKPTKLSLPVSLPDWVLGSTSVKAFNTLYYHRQRPPVMQRSLPYAPFFFPLDALNHWNRMYGKRGFFQYQCVLPSGDDTRPAREIVRRIVQSGQGSFLAVIKTFGDVPSPGLLSFPRAGLTIALDFPNRGASTLQLFDELDAIVAGEGGCVYPAKDARMSPAHFQSFFPQWEEFSRWIDPGFSSSFWRRVTGSRKPQSSQS